MSLEAISNAVGSIPANLNYVGAGVGALYLGRNYIAAAGNKAMAAVTGNAEYEKAASNCLKQAKSDVARDLTVAAAFTGAGFAADFVYDNVFAEQSTSWYDTITSLPGKALGLPGQAWDGVKGAASWSATNWHLSTPAAGFLGFEGFAYFTEKGAALASGWLKTINVITPFAWALSKRPAICCNGPAKPIKDKPIKDLNG
jgi:hypothetical protein